MERVELHCHSNFSASNSVVDAWELVRFVNAHGMTAVAVADTSSVFCYPELYNAQSTEGNNVKVIYGMEALVKEQGYVTLLIRDPEGKSILYRMISAASKERLATDIDFLTLLSKAEHFVLGSGGAEGLLMQAILEGQGENQIEELAKVFDFIEVQPHSNYLYLLEDERYPQIRTKQDLIDLNMQLIELGLRLDIPVVATSNAHYLRKEDEIGRRVIGAHYCKQRDDNCDLHFRNTAEMLMEFAYLDEELIYEIVVVNSNRIAELCKPIEILPQIQCYPKESGKELEDICMLEAKKRYGEPIPKEVMTRMKWELQAVENTETQFVLLYLYRTMKQLGIEPYEIGFRGTAGNAFLFYLLGITDVDPFNYHLSPYFAFGLKQNKILDIDLNVSPARKKEFVDTYQAVNDITGIYASWPTGVDYEESEKIVNGYLQEHKMPCSKQQLMQLVRQISDVRIHRQRHPGGLFVLQKDMDVHDFTPVVTNAEGDLDSYMTSYHLDISLYKQDILQHYGYEWLEQLKAVTGAEPENLQYNEPEIMKLFQIPEDGQEAECKELPDCSGAFMQKVLMEVKPRHFNDLVKVFGFVHGTGVWLENGELLLAEKKVDMDTIIASRDDVYDYLVQSGVDEVTAFTMTEQIRKGIWKKGKSSRYQEFVERMMEANIPDWFIWSCNKILYLFPRAHAIAYAKMNWRLGWYKVHFPEAFHAIASSKEQ